MMLQVHIALIEGKPATYRRQFGDVLHQAMVTTINCPAQDRFQLITEHTKENFYLCAGVFGYSPF